MKEIGKYAEQWNVSSKYFYDNGYYTWMAKKLVDYDTVLEVGCGTGYSTLALLEQGYKVIAIDKNQSCIRKAKELLDRSNVKDNQVIFIEGDITDERFRKALLSSYKFDVIICWNVGSYWNKDMIRYYLPYMLEYGLNVQQIQANPESSYSELIIWEVCRFAKTKNIPAHIVDRAAENICEKNDPYYYTLREEFKYSEIIYDNFDADSISKGGRCLTTNGVVNREKKVQIKFISILLR